VLQEDIQFILELKRLYLKAEGIISVLENDNLNYLFVRRCNMFVKL